MFSYPEIFAKAARAACGGTNRSRSFGRPFKKAAPPRTRQTFQQPARNTSRLASLLCACFLKPLVPPAAGRTERVLSAGPPKKRRRREFNEPFIYLLRRILPGLPPRCRHAFSSRSCRLRRAEPLAFFRQAFQKSGAAENSANLSTACAEYFAACFLAAGMLSQAARAACGGTNRSRSFGRPFKKAAPPRIRQTFQQPARNTSQLASLLQACFLKPLVPPAAGRTARVLSAAPFKKAAPPRIRRRRFFGGPARNRTAVLQGLSADTTRLVCDQISPAGSPQTTCSLGILPYDPLQGRKFSPEVGSLLF